MTVSAGPPFRILCRALLAGLRRWFVAALAVAACSAHSEVQVRVMQTEPPGATPWLSGFMLAVFCLLAIALAWPAWALWKWRDGWRLAVAIPLLMMAVVVLRILIDTTRDPISHNLWPLEILMFGTGSIAIMGVLAVIRRFSRSRQ